MRVLVTGALGMLGSVLLPCLRPEHQVYGVDQKDFDIGEESAVQASFRDLRPEFVFHLAAYTDVDGCEANPAKAEQVNSLGTLNVARACAEIGAGLLYVSTDYVFDGRGNRAYREDDAPNPLSVYGITKLRGERYVQALVARHMIVRSSWLYGPRGKNFVSTILKAARGRGELRVVSDQRGSPTYTRHLALKLRELLAARVYGVFHVTGSGDCSWFEFARAIVQSGGYPRVRVHPISTQEAGRLAPRPAFSVLENHRLTECKLEALPHWTEGLAQYLEEGWPGGEFGPLEPAPSKEALEREVTKS
ncbi:MAG: dTDP-4-dehydrorhamnose reductase [Terriglobia bacterium]